MLAKRSFSYQFPISLTECFRSYPKVSRSFLTSRCWPNSEGKGMTFTNWWSRVHLFTRIYIGANIYATFPPPPLRSGASLIDRSQKFTTLELPVNSFVSPSLEPSLQQKPQQSCTEEITKPQNRDGQRNSRGSRSILYQFTCSAFLCSFNELVLQIPLDFHLCSLSIYLATSYKEHFTVQSPTGNVLVSPPNKVTLQACLWAQQCLKQKETKLDSLQRLW